MNQDRTYDQHIEWCKVGAREFLRRGLAADAIHRMLSDLRKHDETAGVADSLELVGLLYAKNNDLEGAKRFVEGFR